MTKLIDGLLCFDKKTCEASGGDFFNFPPGVFENADVIQSLG